MKSTIKNRNVSRHFIKTQLTNGLRITIFMNQPKVVKIGRFRYTIEIE
jgi:hypothetical protein